MEQETKTQVSQKDAVFNAVMVVLANHGIVLAEGENAKSKLTPELRKAVVTLVRDGFTTGIIGYRKDKSKIKNYAVTITGNWINKDKRICGGAA